ncbi:MAG: sulfur carrier protein ThiS [Nitrospirae bacterium]|nr:sulfur carrier protein ThiS [Nitrospirota bacterium]
MRLSVNGEGREFGKEMTVASLLEALGTPPERVAVELNLQILDQHDYSRTVLKDGDRLEIIRFVGGG